MLDRIRLQNFKTHRDTEINLGRLTVLVGPNGAGKSSVLQAIQLAPNLNSTTRTIPRDMMTFSRGASRPGKCTIKLYGHFSDGKNWDWPNGAIRANEEDQTKTELESVHLEPNPKHMAAPVPIRSATPTLAGDGTGLAEVIAVMRDRDKQRFQALLGALRSIVPQIEQIGILRIEVPPGVPAHSLTFDVAGRREIPAAMMSGGTMLALSILAILHSQQCPRILLIDDLDHGLHPKAQWELLGHLNSVLKQYPELQIIATSHSPDLIDGLEPEQVIVMALREDGTSAAKPLTACPRMDMFGALRAGQLWSAVGEDWVTAENPTSPEPQA